MRYPAALLSPVLLAACGVFGGDDTIVVVDGGVLADICTNAAAASFGVPRYDILLLPQSETRSGTTIPGQAPLAGNAAASFTCQFDRAGRFAGLTRLS